MLLVHLAVVYLLGVAAGQLLWNAGVFGCARPQGLWLVPLALLPLAAWLEHRRPVPAQTPLRWPRAAGFTPPRTGVGPGLLLAGLLVAAAGLLRYAAHPATPCWTPDDLAFYNTPADQAGDAPTVTAIGFVSSYPLRKEGRLQFQVQVERLHLDGGELAVQGQARVTAGRGVEVAYGQPVQIRGRLVEPPVFPDFDYRAYLARKGVHSLIQRPRVEPLPGPLRGDPFHRAIFALRRQGQTLLDRLLPEPYAALANGMLLGVEAGIPDDLYEEFNRTGTSHVIVISGSNVAIVAGVLMALGVHVFGRRRALAPTLAGIGVYAVLVGGDPAVLRASLMGGLFVTATVLNRQTTALVSLSLACWAMTLANPLTLWDVGFQLSSAATAGLILFGADLTGALERIWPGAGQAGLLTGQIAIQGGQLLRGLLQDGLLMTVAANLTTLPLILFYFGRLSVVSLLTNLLIAPVQPFIMLWGGAGLLAGLAGLAPLAQALLWIPYLSLRWTVAMVHWTAGLPGASVEVAHFGTVALAVSYSLLLGMRWRARLAQGVRQLLRWRPQPSPVWLGRVVLPGLAVAGLLTWQMALTQPDGYLHVYFLDVGQGDGILVQTPSGRQVLIDGGSDPQQLYTQLGAVMPFWDRSLDLVIATHPDLDHFGAQVDLPRRFRIHQVVDSANLHDHPDNAAWLAAMESAGVTVASLGAGGWIDLGDGAALWVLWPPPETEMPRVDAEDKNERSLVLRLVYGDFSVLLTGDAGLPSEAQMAAQGAPLFAQVLKVGHHGSKHSTSAAFVQAVHPQIGVIQVGENRYGHPDPGVLDTLAGRPLLRTDQQGRVHLRSDGAYMWLETERDYALEAFVTADGSMRGSAK